MRTELAGEARTAKVGYSARTGELTTFAPGAAESLSGDRVLMGRGQRETQLEAKPTGKPKTKRGIGETSLGGLSKVN